jgi:hypothetical protein
VGVAGPDIVCNGLIEPPASHNSMRSCLELHSIPDTQASIEMANSPSVWSLADSVLPQIEFDRLRVPIQRSGTITPSGFHSTPHLQKLGFAQAT